MRIKATARTVNPVLSAKQVATLIAKSREMHPLKKPNLARAMRAILDEYAAKR